MNPISVSVVLSTYNRAAVLPTALDPLLAQQTDVPYEVIVVNNNSTDETERIVRERMSRAAHLRYVVEPRQGLPYARNAGIRAARGAVIAFTDDDVHVGAGWVATVKRLFDEHPDVDVIGGRVIPKWPSELPYWITRRQLGPFALGERGDAPMHVGAANAAPCLVGANFAFRREVFDRIGLFDSAYIKSQDREIQLRLWRAGGKGLYAPEMAIYVDVPGERLTKAYFRRWYTTYGIYHSRMGLLDALDREGRLVEPAGRRFLGVPGFLYRELCACAGGWIGSLARFDTKSAFYFENRTRYLLSYIRERYRQRAGRPVPLLRCP